MADHHAISRRKLPVTERHVRSRLQSRRVTVSNSQDVSLLVTEAMFDGRRIGGERGDQHSQPEAMTYAPEDAGNFGTIPWRSIALWVSNDRAEAYFEIYQVMPTHLLANRPGPAEWRWRFCMPDGQIRASGGSYTSVTDCRDAVDALRRAAGGARVRQMSKD